MKRSQHHDHEARLLILAIFKAIRTGVRHFKKGTNEELTTPTDVLSVLKSDGEVIVKFGTVKPQERN